MKNTFAVVKQWPDIICAENEAIQRVIQSAALLDKKVIEIDKYGYIIGENKKITHDLVDFVIHFHFETPKTYDAFSFCCSWNPTKFYSDWGFREHVSNLLTHDDFLTCLSEQTDLLVTSTPSFYNAERMKPEIVFSHSLSGPIMKRELSG